MSSFNLNAWEGLGTAVAVVGGFGIAIGQMLKRGLASERIKREKEIDDRIASALTKRDLEDARDELKRLRGPDG